MHSLSQSPTEPGFVQNPYPFYDRLRALGPLVYWQDYDLICAAGTEAVTVFLKDRRFGREAPPGFAPPRAAHTAPFYEVDDNSMLELEPPRHTRLRGLVMRAFTSRRIAKLEAGIAEVCDQRLAAVEGEFDLLEVLGRPLPVITIARLLGVPEEMADQLLAWSNAMVAMYQAKRTYEMEVAAATAASEFSAFIREHASARRSAPADDLITELLAANEDGERLSEAELIATCILLLNAGHEATVHTIGNGARALMLHGAKPEWFTDDAIGATVEEVLRWDPPLHLFTRWVTEDLTAFGHDFKLGDRVGLLLAAANHDPSHWPEAQKFDPTRPIRANASFGSGLHFCVGAPLARLELRIALQKLFTRFPDLRMTEPPVYADNYHFHGLERLMVAPR